MEVMKRSMFVRHINVILIIGLCAQVVPVYTKEYAPFKAMGTAYRGTVAGFKRIGTTLAMEKEKTITRAKKEFESVMAGTRAALKRMRGKTLTEQEREVLRSFEKRAFALLVLVALLGGGMGWAYKKVSASAVPPALPTPPSDLPLPPLPSEAELQQWAADLPPLPADLQRPLSRIPTQPKPTAAVSPEPVIEELKTKLEERKKRQIVPPVVEKKPDIEILEAIKEKIPQKEVVAPDLSQSKIEAEAAKEVEWAVAERKFKEEQEKQLEKERAEQARKKRLEEEIAKKREKQQEEAGRRKPTKQPTPTREEQVLQPQGVGLTGSRLGVFIERFKRARGEEEGEKKGK